MDKQPEIDCMQGFRRLAQVQVYNGWRCPRAGTGMFGHTLRAVIVILGSKGRTKGDPRQYSRSGSQLSKNNQPYASINNIYRIHSAMYTYCFILIC